MMLSAKTNKLGLVLGPPGCEQNTARPTFLGRRHLRKGGQRHLSCLSWKISTTCPSISCRVDAARSWRQSSLHPPRTDREGRPQPELTRALELLHFLSTLQKSEMWCSSSPQTTEAAWTFSYLLALTNLGGLERDRDAILVSLCCCICSPVHPAYPCRSVGSIPIVVPVWEQGILALCVS